MTTPGHDEKGRFTTGHNYGGPNGGGRTEIYTEEWLETELTEMVKWMSKEKNIYYKDFCCERGYAYKRLVEAVDKYPRFSEIMETIQQMQECKYMKGGLTKKFAEGMCTRALTRMGVFDSATSVIIKKESDPVSIAFNEAMGNSKNLVADDHSIQPS
jgi:hypothetical protein